MKAIPLGSGKVTVKGQITIPKEVRDKLKVNSGDILFFFGRNGHVIVIKEISLPE